MVKKAFVFCLIFAILPVFVFGGTTGKIAGTVTDKETGNPLIGANVWVEGTYLGASTDADGDFMILKVPVGWHTVKVSYMGYRTVIEENVRVSVDLTTDVRFAMETEALTTDPVVVTAERKIIRKDETNTNIIKTAEEIQVLPIRGLNNITATVAGVVKQDNSGTMNFRGGRFISSR